MKLKIPKGGKARIIQDIRARGVSTRKAAKALNAVIDAWKLALSCTEEVEVPGGILRSKITQGKPKARLQKFQDIQTKEPIVRPVRYPGWRRVVKLMPDPQLGLRPDAPASESEVMPGAREGLPPCLPVVTYTSVRAEGNNARSNTLPACGEETGVRVQAERVAPRKTRPDLETEVRELITACYRRITDEEYAELTKIYPDETLLISLQSAKLEDFGVEAHLNLSFFVSVLGLRS